MGLAPIFHIVASESATLCCPKCRMGPTDIIDNRIRKQIPPKSEIETQTIWYSNIVIGKHVHFSNEQLNP